MVRSKKLRGILALLCVSVSLGGCASMDQVKEEAETEVARIQSDIMGAGASEFVIQTDSISDSSEKSSQYVFSPTGDIDIEDTVASQKNALMLSSIAGETNEQSENAEDQEVKSSSEHAGISESDTSAGGEAAGSEAQDENRKTEDSSIAGSSVAEAAAMAESSAGETAVEGSSTEKSEASAEGTYAVLEATAGNQNGESEVIAASSENTGEAVAATSEAAGTEATVQANTSNQTAQSASFSEQDLQQICAFYNGTVFAGDSVMLGFRNYSKKSSDPMLNQLQFLAAGSLSLHNSFWEVSSKSVHPLYQGEQHPIWESIQMMGARKVFLFFGINDVVYNLDDNIALYSQLVDKIKEYSPGIDVTIISATYTLKDKGKGKLNNANLAEFNRAIQQLAAQNGWGYVDMATPLSDGEGNLAPQYCSDGFLHESNKAYEVWNTVLKKYAAGRLGIKETTQEAPQASE